MKRNKFLAVLLCGCLLAGSISSNTYASVLSEDNNETVMEEAAENETETEVYIEKDITEESESEFDEVLSEEESQTKTDVAEYESETESEIKTEIKSDEETVQEDVTQEETVQETKTSEETEIDEEATTDVEEKETIEETTNVEETIEETTDVEETETIEETTDVEETETIEEVTTEDEILTDMQTDEADMPLKGVNADGSVTINEANFPDSAFRKYVSDEIDKDDNGVLSKKEIENIYSIFLYNKELKEPIVSLKGIEYFVNLETISCRELLITELDLSSNSKLEYVYCEDNELMKLDLSNNPELRTLYCDNNCLAKLDLSNSPKLKMLRCEYNYLNKIELSKNVSLETLWCNHNKLSELDLSNCTKLTELRCQCNSIQKLDLSNCFELKLIWCFDNKINKLDLSDCKKLQRLDCDDNNLKKLDLSKNVMLENIDLGNNLISKLDLSNNIELKSLNCRENELDKLDLSNNIKLEYLECAENPLIILNLKNNENTFSNITIYPIYDVLIYCTANTWLEEFFKKKNIEYSTSEPIIKDEFKEDDKEVAIFDIKDAIIKCEKTYLNVKKNNAPQVPKLTSVTLDGKKLKKNKDFTVSYSFEGRIVEKLTVCGKYTMTIIGKGKYTGSKSIAINVTEKKLLSKANIKLNAMDYTGNAITSGVIKSVKLNGVSLEEGKDYTVSYKNNINSGKGTVILTAVGSSNYTGIVEKTFNIKGVKMSNVKISGVKNLSYSGGEETVHNSSDIVVKYKGELLKKGKDYTVSYENNKNAGNAKIIFTGIGKYNGVIKKGFKIKYIQLSEVTLDSAEISREYKKGGVTPNVKLTYNGVRLVKDKDYKLTYKNNENVTTEEKKAKIIIKGIGNYKGTLNKEFSITKKILGYWMLEIPDVKYESGKKTYTTDVKLYDRGTLLVENKDYKITFEEKEILSMTDKEVWDYFEVEGIGNYSGRMTTYFRILKNM